MYEHMQAAEKVYCPRDGGVRGPEQTIEFESNQIKLDIPTEGIELENGWKVTPILNPVVSIFSIILSYLILPYLTQITKKDVDKYEPPKVIPNCPLLASFAEGKVDIPMFLYRVKLIGAREPHNMVVINCKPTKLSASGKKI